MSGQTLQKQILHAESADEIAEHITLEYGLLIRVADTWNLMGFASPEAARRAALRGSFPIRLLCIPNRRGSFIKSRDLAQWLFVAMGGQGEHPVPHPQRSATIPSTE